VSYILIYIKLSANKCRRTAPLAVNQSSELVIRKEVQVARAAQDLPLEPLKMDRVVVRPDSSAQVLNVVLLMDGVEKALAGVERAVNLVLVLATRYLALYICKKICYTGHIIPGVDIKIISKSIKNAPREGLLSLIYYQLS
jgi:hypothetical protein